MNDNENTGFFCLLYEVNDDIILPLEQLTICLVKPQERLAKITVGCAQIPTSPYINPSIIFLKKPSEDNIWHFYKVIS